MDIDPYFGNNVGDNLTDDNEDYQDENESYNWTNNPIRKLFDNPKNQYERTHREPSIPDDE
jgi:hypothetical protein